MPDQISRIGTRGVVLHWGDPVEGRYGYFSDNNVSSWRTREITTDLVAWLGGRGASVDDVRALVRLNVIAAFVPGAKLTLFLNLDAFGDLDKDADLLGNTSGAQPDADAVLIRESQEGVEHYYAVSMTEFEAIEPANAGEARGIVKRGAIAAAIPNNTVPYGTNCVLVNLTQVIPPRQS